MRESSSCFRAGGLSDLRDANVPAQTSEVSEPSEVYTSTFDQSVGGWTNVIFSVDDVEEAVVEMKEAGVTVVEEPQTFDWGQWAVVADRDGNQFGLSASPAGEGE